MTTRVASLIVTLGGVGRLPIAPGTWGSLVVALPGLLGPVEYPWLLWAYTAGVVAFVAAGLWAIPYVQEEWGKDPSRVVIDEAAGMALVLAAPIGASSPWWLLASFLIFRVYDIAKPFPANVFNRRSEAWAVIADDLVAAVYTVVTLYVLQFLVNIAAPLLAHS